MVQSAVSVGDEMAGSLLSGCVQDTSAARRETAADSPVGPCPSFGCMSNDVTPSWTVTDKLLLLVVADKLLLIWNWLSVLMCWECTGPS